MRISVRPAGISCGKALAPFDQHQSVAIEQLVQAQRGHLARLVQAVEIHVVDAPAAVFVNQREGGARYLVGPAPRPGP